MCESDLYKDKFSNKIFHTYKIKTEFLIGCLLGALVFLFIYGIKVLDFTYDGWLLPNRLSYLVGDLHQHYLGWVAYRKSDWHFPIGLIDNIVYPDKISVIYTDSIPLFAIFFKIFSGILPDTFQYMGLFGLFCFALHGGFAEVILSRFSDKRIFNLLFGMFFIMSYPLFLKMYRHTSLSAHWLILAAFSIWLYDGKLSEKQKILFWVVLNSITPLIHFYFFPMVFGIMCGSLLYNLIFKKNLKYVLSTLVGCVIGVVAVGYVFGMFYGEIQADSIGYYGVFKFNLNSFINAQQGSSGLLSELPAVSPYEWEGFAFLGVGILMLIAINAVKNLFSDAVFQIDTLEARALCVSVSAVAVIFILFSASNNIALNDKTILSVDLPERIYKLLSIFRVSGRMIWPVYYGIVLLTAYLLYCNFKTVPVRMCLIAGSCLLLQLCDSSLFYVEKGWYSKDDLQFETVLQSPAWDFLAEKYEHLIFYPRSNKLYTNTGITYCFEKYCLDNDISMNITYLARAIPGIDKNAVNEYMEYYGGKTPPTDTMWIFHDYVPVKMVSGMHYYIIDGIVVGLPVYHKELQEYEVIQEDLIEQYSADEFDSKKGTLSGASGLYSFDEADYIWAGKDFLVYLKSSLLKEGKIKICLETQRSLCMQQCPDIAPVVSVIVNNEPVKEIEMTDGYLETEIEVDTAGQDYIEIELYTDAYFNPKQLGLNEDGRDMGIGVSYIGP